MTLPTFDPLPFPQRTALANLPPVADGQADITDANFAKVNTYLAGLGPLVAQAQNWMLQGISNATTPWGNFTPAQWPMLTFTVPATCWGVVTWIQAQMYPNNAYVSIGAEVRGNGLLQTFNTDMTFLDATWQSGCEVVIWPGVRPNQPITMQPTYACQSGGWIGAGRMGIIALG